MSDFIRSMPKAELHVHLEGTLEPELSFELARRNAVALPYRSREELLAAYDFHDLPSFLAIYYGAMKVLKEEQIEDDLQGAHADAELQPQVSAVKKRMQVLAAKKG